MIFRKPKLSSSSFVLFTLGNIYLSNVPDYAGALILAGLRHINALGGSKSAGLGWLHWEFPDLPVEKKAWEFLAKGSEKS